MCRSVKDGGLLATFIGFLPHRNKYSGVMVLRQISLCNPTNFFFFKKRKKNLPFSLRVNTLHPCSQYTVHLTFPEY